MEQVAQNKIFVLNLDYEPRKPCSPDEDLSNLKGTDIMRLFDESGMLLLKGRFGVANWESKSKKRSFAGRTFIKYDENQMLFHVRKTIIVIGKWFADEGPLLIFRLSNEGGKALDHHCFLMDPQRMAVLFHVSDEPLLYQLKSLGEG